MKNTLPAPRIGLISGSTRSGSINSQNIRAMGIIFKEHGAKTSVIDLAKFDMPIYQGDWELANGQPGAARKLIKRIKSYDGIFISTPEYNGCMPPLLKNVIDWTSRLGTSHFTGPVYGIGACSPGPMSGVIALNQLRFILARLGASVVPVQLGVGNAASAYGKNGRYADGRTAARAEKLAQSMLAEIARRG